MLSKEQNKISNRYKYIKFNSLIDCINSILTRYVVMIIWDMLFIPHVSFTPHKTRRKPQNRWFIQKSTQMPIKGPFWSSK